MKSFFKSIHFRLGAVAFFALVILFFAFPDFFSSASTYKKGENIITETVKKLAPSQKPLTPPFDPAAYDKKMLELANNPPPKPPVTKVVKDPKTGVETTVTTTPPIITYPWPAKAPYPKAGAILPFHRIIAYYGNLYSTKMGVLGEYPEDIMLAKLDVEVKKWTAADPTTPAIPALHYITVVAQGSAGADGKYRARMPDKEVDKVIAMAAKINALVFLDVQVGFSTIQAELPLLEKYLKLPNVHFGMDPEFSMKNGIRPGKIVGTYDAADINFAAEYLAKIVKDNNLPPKILIVHRYTGKMVTNAKLIKPLPEVQVVMDMDGWGGQAKKIGTYKNFIYPEPVQFTGFKLFYKNDILTPGTTLMTPADLLKLSPRPSYIQFQ